MRTGLLLVFAACAAARPAPAIAPPPPPLDTITLGYQPPPAGSRWRTVVDQSIDFTMPKVGGVHTGKREVKTIEIVKVDGQLVTAKRGTYQQYREEQSTQGHTSDQPSPLEGNTYLIEDAAGGPVVHAAEGGEVPADDVARILKDERVGDAYDRFGRYLDGKTFRIDDEVEIPKDELSDFMGDAPIDRARMTLSYRGPEGPLVGFDLTMSASGGQDGAHISFSLTGHVAFDAPSGQSGALHVSGPIQVSGPYQAIGTMTFGSTNTRL